MLHPMLLVSVSYLCYDRGGSSKHTTLASRHVVAGVPLITFWPGYVSLDIPHDDLSKYEI